MASFQEKIQAASKHPLTRDEQVKYYSARYGDAWKQKLAEDIQPYTRGRGGQPQSIRNIRRRFENRMGRNWWQIQPSRAAQAQYAELGQTINIPPEGGYEVSGNATFYISRTRVTRHFTVRLTGQAAQYFADTGDVNILTGAYFAGHEQGGVFYADSTAVLQADLNEGWDGEPDMDVDAA